MYAPNHCSSVSWGISKIFGVDFNGGRFAAEIRLSNSIDYQALTHYYPANHFNKQILFVLAGVTAMNVIQQLAFRAAQLARVPVGKNTVWVLRKQIGQAALNPTFIGNTPALKFDEVQADVSASKVIWFAPDSRYGAKGSVQRESFSPRRSKRSVYWAVMCFCSLSRLTGLAPYSGGFAAV